MTWAGPSNTWIINWVVTMADIKSPIPGDTNATGNATVFTFQEQLTASVSLYTMSLICIVIGGIRSANFVQRMIRKKRPIENSIRMSEAKKFPLSASAVLFGLYIFFKPAAERLNWVVTAAQKLHVPENYIEKINATITNFMTPAEGVAHETLFQRLLKRLPSNINEFLQTYLEKLPAIGKDELMIILTFLICFEGISALAILLKPALTFLLNRLPFVPECLRFNRPYLLSIKKGLKEMDEGDMEEASTKDTEYVFKLDCDRHILIALLLCSPVLISHLTCRHWITNNIIGIAFSIVGIECLHLASFKAGTLLLAGLFIYDIFWVFATDVMTSVAKGINAPILLQFPQDIYRNGFLEANKYSMLGLGDIVIPGIFIALLRRFDYRVGEQGSEAKKANKGRRYFFAITIIAYAVGLLLTMYVMHYFKAAQPALLYLVPCCLLVPLTVAALTGELSALWNYDEGHLVQDDDKKNVDSAKKNN
ncbi:unnamed protein product [Caenorhabditis auriculariae]|uniref:Uncharacterized protein n=1 Tax=Caenorhabditis auriculariae TaxID=2777116 RepID=A0A8S1HKG0_9PELO|nr:unnamed protein product [Caenorhabditis auriculariae]